MRSLISIAVLASVTGLLASTAFAADLDYPPPPPPPYYEPHPVPPAFVPGPVPPVFYRGPRLYPRPIVYPRPYPLYAPRPVPVVRAYPGPGPYAEGGYERPFPREPRGYGEPGYREGYGREAEVYRGRDGYDGRERGFERGGPERGYGREPERRVDPRYGHYLSREELDRRVEREPGFGRDRYADREQPRDFER